MTRRTLLVLGVVLGALTISLILLNQNDDNASGDRAVFAPGLKAIANDASQISIVRSGTDDVTAVRSEGGTWELSSKGNYPADVGKLGQLISDLVDARILEEKTSNPENYARLGVADPGEDGAGTLVTVDAAGESYSVILGEPARGETRYAREPDNATSYLIDKNPAAPESASDWLVANIVDISSDRVARISIEHDDGESIRVEKSDETQSDFVIGDIPEGRELSYATIGNEIAGALADLQLADVRKAADAPAETMVQFDTWDGLRLNVDAITDNETTWLSFAAAPTGEDAQAEDEIAALNTRLSGWQYQVSDYKKDQLVRRWEDILKAEDPPEEAETAD
jgi:hypothetical protein